MPILGARLSTRSSAESLGPPQEISSLASEAISHRPRLSLVESSDEDRFQEYQRIGFALRERPIGLEGGFLTDAMKKRIQNIAEVLREYPEMPVTLEGYLSRSESSSYAKEKFNAAAARRAQAVKNFLQQQGVCNDLNIKGMGVLEAHVKGSVVILVPDTQVPLLDPPKRLNFILCRTFFEFAQGKQDFTEKGKIVADMVAQVCKEANKNLIITCPQRSSPLAMKRADQIVEGLQSRGFTSDISVKRAKDAQTLVTLHFEGSNLPKAAQKSSDAEPCSSPRVENAAIHHSVKLKDAEFSEDKEGLHVVDQNLILDNKAPNQCPHYCRPFALLAGFA